MKKKLLFLFFIFANSIVRGQTAQLNCIVDGFNDRYFINNVLQWQGTCNNTNNKIHIAVLDSCSFVPWTTDSCTYGYFGQANHYSCLNGFSTCTGVLGANASFQFQCNVPNQVNALINMLNSVPSGYHILAYNYLNLANLSGDISCTGFASIRNAFTQLGSSMLNSISDTVPFIFYIKKGNPSTLHEVSGAYASDTVSLIRLKVHQLHFFQTPPLMN